MNMHDFNKKKYADFWKELNKELAKKSSLREALLALEEQQFDAGFIQDDLKSVRLFRLHNPYDKTHVFIIQYNPKRADRYAGIGRKLPPLGSESINKGCFLCRENIRWQQQGVEVGYDIHTARADYIAWMNPFPLKPGHTTIAARDHISQSWITDDDEESTNRFQSILRDLLELSNSLPDFIGFYNGVGAGASIPNHFHFHFFQRPEGSGPFPLERAAMQTMRKSGDASKGIIVRDYPITVIYFHGTEDKIIDATTQWIDKFARVRRYRNALTANIIVAVDSDEPSSTNLYIVPRNKYFSHAPGMVGVIGGLEILGEIVFSSEVEKQLLDRGQVDYQFVERILSAVEPLGIINEALK